MQHVLLSQYGKNGFMGNLLWAVGKVVVLGVQRKWNKMRNLKLDILMYAHFSHEAEACPTLIPSHFVLLIFNGYRMDSRPIDTKWKLQQWGYRMRWIYGG
jgi:hypothetical protein